MTYRGFNYQPNKNDLKIIKHRKLKDLLLYSLIVVVVILALLLVQTSMELVKYKKVSANMLVIDSAIPIINLNQYNQDELNLDEQFDGVLTDTARLFIKYGKAYDVDPYLLAAISIHETGNGTSNLAITKNNICGCMQKHTAMEFLTIEDSIHALARLLKYNYLDLGLTTIEQIGSKYAPIGVANDPNNLNSYWADSVSNIYAKLTLE